MLKIDCLGEMCPIPVMRLQQSLKENRHSEIIIVSDHSCVVPSVEDYCKKNNLQAKAIEVMSGIWEITIRQMDI